MYFYRRLLNVVWRILLSAIFVVGVASCAASTHKRAFVIWVQRDAHDVEYDFARELADAFSRLYPAVQVELVGKGIDMLDEFEQGDFTAGMPDVLWVVGDRFMPLVPERIRALDGLFDVQRYLLSLVADGQTWAIPISFRNQLLLFYNKRFLSRPPQTSDELVAVTEQLTTSERYGLVWNQLEPLWLVPWLGGFGGHVFAADGVTPTLDTDAMRDALQLLVRLRYAHRGLSPALSYDDADRFFKQGRAAMIVNGSWALDEYASLLGTDLGVAPLPRVAATGNAPTPYVSGEYFMLPTFVQGRALRVATAFIRFATSHSNQLRLFTELHRLPALRSALAVPLITESPTYAGAALQLAAAVPMPSTPQMRCNWQAMKPEMIAAFAAVKTAGEAAADMQRNAERCVGAL